MNSYKFFCNKECEYFPCHSTENPDEFNCLFCFCPLYHMEDCGGNHVVNENGVKNCTDCLVPHRRKNYEYIMDKLKENNKKSKER